MTKLSRILLFPFSLLYGMLMGFRNKLYNWGFFKSKHFNLPVISVGNLAIGGTGKTPHTEYLIRLLQDNFNISTLSRGYKRKSKGFLLSNEKSTISDIGDEPLQYRLKFKKINVAVDEKRVHGIQKIKELCPNTNIILLDDAYQHRAVTPGLNILITEYNNLYIDDFVIPSGRLREWKSGSDRANIIIVSKTNNTLSIEEIKRIRTELNPKSYQNVYFSFIKYGEITPFTKAAKDIPPTTTNNYSILLLTGIAKPTPLYNKLSKQYKSIDHLQFPDHHNFNSSDIEEIIKSFNNINDDNKLIISTEKDIMRLSLPEILNNLKDIPIFYIPIEICFHEDGKKEFDQEILNYVAKNKRD